MKIEESINRIELRGIVGSQRISSVGDVKMIMFSVATNHVYNSKEGASPFIETTWFQCVAMDKDFNLEDERFRKGNVIHIEGRLRSQRYTNGTGGDVNVYVVIVSKIFDD